LQALVAVAPSTISHAHDCRPRLAAGTGFAASVRGWVITRIMLDFSSTFSLKRSYIGKRHRLMISAAPIQWELQWARTALIRGKRRRPLTARTALQ
jgi:hypothetical protein